MRKIAKFGYVWKHTATGKIQGCSIDISNFEELHEYEQVPKEQLPKEEATQEQPLKTTLPQKESGNISLAKRSDA